MTYQMLIGILLLCVSDLGALGRYSLPSAVNPQYKRQAYKQKNTHGNQSEESQRRRFATQKWGKILLLDAKINQLRSLFEEHNFEGQIDDKESIGFDASSKSYTQEYVQDCVKECRNLSKECELDTSDIDWQKLMDDCSQVKVRACPAGCPRELVSLANKVSMVLTKICDIQMLPLGGRCGTPITQAMLPLTIASGTDDGKKYYFSEPLTHTGGTSAITVTARGVTIDMNGFAFTGTALSVPAIEISGDQCTLTNGVLCVTSSSAPVISITATAEQAILQNLGIRVDSWIASGVISSAGEQNIIQDVSILVDSGSGGVGLLGDGIAGTIDVDGFNLIALGTTTGTGISINGRSSIRNAVVRLGDPGDFGPQGTGILVSSMSSDVGMVIDNAFIVHEIPGGTTFGGRFDGVVVSGTVIGYLIKEVTVYGVSDPFSTNQGGIKTLGGSSGIITDCQVTSGIVNFPGIGFVIEGNNTELRGNRAFGGYIGFYVFGSNCVLENNDAVYCYTGFDLERTDGLLRNNTVISQVGGFFSKDGFVFGGASSGWVVRRNNATGCVTGYQDNALGPVNFFATNYAAACTTPYAGAGFFATYPPVAAAASTSYWDNVIA